MVGSEQAGTRPVLVISDQDFNQLMPVITVLPLTSRKPGRKIYPNEVRARICDALRVHLPL
ncbi:MAG: type II toxin-antitoxin system PemK/MazF family toxin [Acidobacteriota bacterium]